MQKEKLIIFFNKNKKIITCVACLLLFIVIAFLLVSLVLKSFHKTEYRSSNINLYQYFMTERNDFRGHINYEDNKIVSIKGKNYKISLDYPVYFKNKRHLITTSNMSMVLYKEDFISYKLPLFSEIFDSSIVVSDGDKYKIESFFLYDGEGLYIFPRDSVLKVNGQKYNLSSLSYVFANGGNVIFYDFASDSIKLMDNITSASIVYDGVLIDAFGEMINYKGKLFPLIGNSNNLSTYKEG